MIVGDVSSWGDLFLEDMIPAMLDFVITTWEHMPKPGPSDREDPISLKLYCAMRRSQRRNDLPFAIDYQPLEIDIDLEQVVGRKDIVFLLPPPVSRDIYFCLEAKRLNAVSSGKIRSLADGYVKEGMQRFVDGKYARRVHHGAMLGYVLDGNIDRAIRNVDGCIGKRLKELRMKKNGKLLDSTIRPDDLHTKETHHKRQKEKATFRIHHLFLVG